MTPAARRGAPRRRRGRWPPRTGGSTLLALAGAGAQVREAATARGGGRRPGGGRRTGGRARSSSPRSAARPWSATCSTALAGPGARCRSSGRCTRRRCPAGSARSTWSSRCRCPAAAEGPLAVAAEAARRGCRLLTVGAAGSPLADVCARARGVHVPVARGAALVALEPVGARRAGAARRRRARPGRPVDAATCSTTTADGSTTVAERARPSSESFVNPAKALALDLAGSIPLVLGDGRPRRGRARRAAAQLARNARHPAVAGVLPDAAARGRGDVRRAVRAQPRRTLFADPRSTTRRRSARPRCGCCCCATTTSTEDARRRTGDRRRAGHRHRRAACGSPSSRATRGHGLARLAGLVALTDFASVYLALGPGLDPATSPHVADLQTERDRRMSASGRHQGDRRGARSRTSASRCTKFVAFLVTGSSSMLAEAVHSVADSGNQVLLLVGGHRAQRAADDGAPVRLRRQRYVYAFVVSIVLFSVGGLFALYEGVHKIAAPGGDRARRQWPIGRAARRDRAGVVLVAHGGQGARPHPRRSTRGGSSSAARRAPSCRSCCWRTRPP